MRIWVWSARFCLIDEKLDSNQLVIGLQLLNNAIIRPCDVFNGCPLQSRCVWVALTSLSRLRRGRPEHLAPWSRCSDALFTVNSGTRAPMRRKGFYKSLLWLLSGSKQTPRREGVFTLFRHKPVPIGRTLSFSIATGWNTGNPTSEWSNSPMTFVLTCEVTDIQGGDWLCVRGRHVSCEVIIQEVSLVDSRWEASLPAPGQKHSEAGSCSARVYTTMLPRKSIHHRQRSHICGLSAVCVWVLCVSACACAGV